MNRIHTLICLLLSLCTIVSATDYYVSSSGDDNLNTGKSSSSPWKSITKINSVFSTIQPGDRILFNRGDTFYGTLNISKSGLSGAPITIGAYGTGSQPIITGLTTLSSWTNEGNGIFSKIVTSEAQTNMVLVDGIQVRVGRYPDAGTNLTYTTVPSPTQITDPEIGSSTDWAGAEIVININDWTLDRCKVSSLIANVFTFTNLGSRQTAEVNRYYFIQNDIRCVTSTNEWYHSTSAGKLYIYGDPSTKTVKMATLNYLINNAAYDYITIDNINFQGSISHAIYCTSASNNWTVQNCTFSFIGYDGIYVAGGNNWVIDNNTMSYCNSSGVYTTVNTCSIINNTITNIGMLPGQSFLYHSTGIFISGSAFAVQYNDVRYTAWSGIQSSSGTSFTIKNNFIFYPCQVLDDGGGIYFPSPFTGQRIVEGNIILNSGVGGSDYNYTRGIYLDAFASNVIVKDNTTAFCVREGLMNGGGINNTYTGNTSYNNSSGMFFQQYSTSTIITGTTLKNNIFFARESTQYTLRFSALTNNIADFGTADNNYYARPIKDDNVFNTYQPSTGTKNRILSDWQSFTAQDVNSFKSPLSITNTNDILFEYNASKNNKVVSLTKPMIDVTGKKYTNVVTLLPYTSIILMVDPNPSQTMTPVYLSSVIENATPTILEMTYSQTLAGVTPETTAFPVLVNGSSRSITSVAISGTKVRLTLSSSVAYGDVVTVAYNKSTTNPLQATSGDPAETITAQTVVNNINPPSPVYVSSVIENATPSRLDMTYNLTLANIAPAASSFTVKVNTISRTVSSVSISGTKVILTLASPVVYGDNVTVAYTKPATNPIQTAAGGQATSITAQPVTNNVSPVLPEYNSSVTENATPDKLEITFNLALANIVPAVSAFSVLVDNVVRNVNSVTISGAKVTLTIASPVVFGNTITVAYSKPATNPLQTASGGQAATFTAKPATNNVTPAIPVYVSSFIANATPSVLEMTYNLALANIVPAASAFTVMVNSVTRSVSSVTVSGTKVLLTLTSPVIYGNAVTVAYTKPAANPIQTTSGGQAATISAQTVTNNVNPVNPVYVSSIIENATPSVLEMNYDLTLANIAPPSSAFTVMVNSTGRTVSSVSVSGTKVLLTLASPVVYNDAVTVAYTKPATNPLQTASGGQAAAITAQNVTNNVNPATLAYISSAVSNAAPSVLEITYSLTLANIIPDASAFTVVVNSVTRTVNSVTISGTKVQLTLANPIINGDVVTVAYTKPASNPLQTSLGEQAVTISAQSVTNNVGLVNPVYLSSVIQDAAPSILEMTYDLSLANIVPPASAFTVMVNSVARAVNSVAVSGNKVLLTLANPVVYGNGVTVAYTKPATSTLQTPSGGQAATISAQTVTNNVNPVDPVYVNSVIENATPSILEITYDQSLANIVPAASAFTVIVNSTARSVSSVTVSGTKVLLTLSSPALYSDNITVAYTKPATSPLQTSSGGTAASFSAQPVTNNCIETLSSPVVVVNYQTNAYSGFVYEIDASGSYDPNDDLLTFAWTAPSNVPVSSLSGSKIRFLSPIVTGSTAIEIGLGVSDGTTTQSKNLSINILPYKPDLAMGKIDIVEASNSYLTDIPDKAVDGNLSTKWSMDGDNHWIRFDLPGPFKISHLQVAFLPDQDYESYFDIFVSQDKISWEPVLLNAKSCDFSGAFQVFDFPVSLTTTDYSSVKLVGHGNSLNTWNYFSEFKLFGIPNPSNSNDKTEDISIYPNPASEFINVIILEPFDKAQQLRIFDFNGKLFLENRLDHGINNKTIPINLGSGVYIVQVKMANKITFTQKLLVIK